MRKYPLVLLIVLLAVAIGAAACETDNPVARAQLQTAWNAGKDVTSQSGSYEIALTASGDTSKVPAGFQGIAQALVGQPIVLTGDFAFSGDPLGAEVSANTSLMAMALGVGGLVSDGKAYLQVSDQWYEAPDKAQSGLAQILKTAGLLNTIKQTITDSGVDPTTWCTKIKVAGEETLADTQVVHLTSKLDVKKMFADLTTLMQSKQFAQLAASSGATDQSAAVPSATELEGQLDEAKAMFKNATVDFWLAKSDSTMRKMTLTTDLVAPKDSATSGITGANVVATVNLGQPGQAVTVKAPALAKPYADLKQDLRTHPLFGLFLGGMSAPGSGSDSATTTTLGL